MRKLVILVAGGTGFVGRHVVALLQSQGHRVILHNRTHRAVPTHADVIVNCVGIIREDEQRFKEAHVDLAQWLVRLGKKLNVRQFVQVSALGIDPPRTEYQRTKLQAERIIIGSGLSYAIIRPSMIFGPEDKSINMFRAICRTGFFPLFAEGKVQPVHVDTVARTIIAAIEGRIRDRIVEVGGPETFTYRELAGRIHPGVRVFKMPKLFTSIITSFGVIIRSFPTREQVIMLGHDNTTTDKTVERLAIKNPRLS